uniref:uracil-DNA glycosylase n=1 Tax=Myxine glutinosa TaxID=7769 RepID=UPI003590103F
MLGTQTKLSKFFEASARKRVLNAAEKLSVDPEPCPKRQCALSTRNGEVSNSRRWSRVLEEEFDKPYYIELEKFITVERKKFTVYPPPRDLFTWSRLCEMDKVKVVILGQDPYHGPGQAHGLCFSVNKPVRPPPSLQNIFRELTTDIEGFVHPGHGDLSGWAKQGVLLLNSVLTVRAGEPNSHCGRGWEQVTGACLSALANSRCQTPLVFLLWGANAQKRAADIKSSEHHILRAPHPSPLSAHRGFFGCRHFSKANALLEKSGQKPIDWAAL